MYNSIKCLACNFESENFALLNRHISKCKNYDVWIKTYKPEYFKCKNCELNFTNIEKLNEHNCENK